jgi:protease I
MTKNILMIVGDFTETLEAFVPMMTLRTLGFNVDVCCPNKTKGDTVTTAVHDFSPICQTYTEKPGHALVITVNFPEINPKNYDGLYLPGGRAPEYLRINPKVCEIVKSFIECNKPIAAMCHGPQILLATGCMPGRKMTCYPTIMPECTMTGTQYVKIPNDECLVDNNIVTAPTWMACPRMMTCFTELLGCKITPPTPTTL